MQSFGEIVAPGEARRSYFKCPDDDPVIYTALAGGADVLCTVDARIEFFKTGTSYNTFSEVTGEG